MDLEASKQAAIAIRLTYLEVLNNYSDCCITWGLSQTECDAREEKFKTLIKTFRTSLAQNYIHIIHAEKLFNLRELVRTIQDFVSNRINLYFWHFHIEESRQRHAGPTQGDMRRFDYINEQCAKIEDRINHLINEVEKDFIFLIRDASTQNPIQSRKNANVSVSGQNNIVNVGGNDSNFNTQSSTEGKPDPNSRPILLWTIITGLLTAIVVAYLIYDHVGSKNDDRPSPTTNSNPISHSADFKSAPVNWSGNNNGNISLVNNSTGITVNQTIQSNPNSLNDLVANMRRETHLATDTSHVQILAASNNLMVFAVLLDYPPLSNSIEATANNHFMMSLEEPVQIQMRYNLGLITWHVVDTNATTFTIKYIANTQETNFFQRIPGISFHSTRLEEKTTK